jgi:hypothetical protein
MFAGRTVLMKSSCLILGWAVMLISAGCGSSSSEFEIAPARGTVTIDGKPLANAKITFAPEHGPSANAESDTSGAFVLSSNGKGDGAVVGRHTVTVTARGSSHEDMKGSPLMPVPGQSLIPVTYGDPTTSGLEFEVAEGRDNTFEIQLSSQAAG